jgi:nitrate/TMAO reductase-like tetraheme cytochrome c subunit
VEKHENDTECPNPKKCVNCKLPNDKHGSFDKDKRKHHYTHEGRSRHLPWDGPKNLRRKNTSLKKTYAEIVGKFINDLAKDEANEMQAFKE